MNTCYSLNESGRRMKLRVSGRGMIALGVGVYFLACGGSVIEGGFQRRFLGKGD